MSISTAKVGDKATSDQVRALPAGSVVVDLEEYQSHTRAGDGTWVFTDKTTTAMREFMVVYIPEPADEKAPTFPVVVTTPLYRRITIRKTDTDSYPAGLTVQDTMADDELLSALTADNAREIAHALLEAIGDETTFAVRPVGEEAGDGTRVRLIGTIRNGGTIPFGSVGTIKQPAPGVDVDGEYWVSFDNYGADYVHYNFLVLA